MLFKDDALSWLRMLLLQSVLMSVFIRSELVRWVPHSNRSIRWTWVQQVSLAATSIVVVIVIVAILNRCEELVHVIRVSGELIHADSLVEVPQFYETISSCCCNIDAVQGDRSHASHSFLMRFIIVALELILAGLFLVPNTESVATCADEWFHGIVTLHATQSCHRFVLIQSLRAEQFV